MQGKVWGSPITSPSEPRTVSTENIDSDNPLSIPRAFPGTMCADI